MAKKSISALEAQLEAERQNVEQLRKRFREEEEARRVAQKEVTETRQQFADLKERLANAESANQFMRGYIARLQEDDVVREELVATGDPDGEQVMRPKRKHTHFERPQDYQSFDECNSAMGYVGRQPNERNRPGRKHWVTY